MVFVSMMSAVYRTLWRLSISLGEFYGVRPLFLNQQDVRFTCPMSTDNLSMLLFGRTLLQFKNKGLTPLLRSYSLLKDSFLDLCDQLVSRWLKHARCQTRWESRLWKSEALMQLERVDDALAEVAVVVEDVA